MVLARRWRRTIDHELLSLGLTDATWTPLIHLAESGDGISQTELAGRVGLDASSLVRLLDLLTERGFVERRVDPDDRRARRVVLTPAGEAEVTRIRAKLLEVETELLADLDDGVIETMLQSFARIEARARDMLSEDRTR